MNLSRDGVFPRVLVAVIIGGVGALAIWGVWVLVAVVIGMVGWLFSQLGALLQRITDFMASLRGFVAWVAFGCGIIAGGFLSYTIPPRRFVSLLRDRLWARDRAVDRDADLDRTPAGRGE